MSFLFYANLILLSACAVLVCHYSIEKKVIRDFAIRAIKVNKEPLEVVIALSGIIFNQIKAISCKDDPHFIPFPVLSSLGATPMSILRNGGCCSGLTRLNIVALSALGFEAGQVTVCHASGNAVHCLLEVALPTHNLLIDPTYGFYYVDEKGLGIGLSDLHHGARPSFTSLPYSNATGYPHGSYYDFDYLQTKTANWTRSRLRRAVYRILLKATRGAIDSWKQPVVLEWPQAILAASIVLFLMVMNLTMLLIDIGS